jgi:hypothetical protein
MPRHSSRTALALVLALGATPLLAAPGRTARAVTPPAPAGAVQQLWNGLVALWNAAGCVIDPNGISRCAAVASSSSSPAPAGCTGDPDGIRCAASRSTAPLPEGCIGDPNGLCVSQH